MQLIYKMEERKKDALPYMGCRNSIMPLSEIRGTFAGNPIFCFLSCFSGFSDKSLIRGHKIATYYLIIYFDIEKKSDNYIILNYRYNTYTYIFYNYAYMPIVIHILEASRHADIIRKTRWRPRYVCWVQRLRILNRWRPRFVCWVQRLEILNR